MFDKMDDIKEKADELLSDVELRIESLFEDFEITESIGELMEKLEKADKSYRLALDDPDIYLKLAFVCFSNEEFDRAEAWAKKSLRLKNSFLGFFIKGIVLQKKNDNKGAIGEYDEALKYDEKAIVYQYKYKALKDRSMPQRALDAIDKALETEETAQLLAEKADLLIEVDRVGEAKELYDKAEELNPDIKNRERKIDDLMVRAEKKLVPEVYDKILKLDDEHSEAWLGKARCYWEMDEGEKAKETIEGALKYIDDERILDKLEEYREKADSALKCPECDGDGRCSNCGGTGDCISCEGSGNCLDCDGTAECFDCLGSGDCPNCDGDGKTGWFSRCEVCSGTGTCQTCEGYGHCVTCEGTGDCQSCGGNGNCEDCQGSGVCKVCDGKGVKVD
ncbi:MAG: hypothetical protein KGY68_00310 [Candidatus Thermoplasmatota archaeon]|nr:hypothetical protein [Candidatus Thermoplasmatota archaeon]